MIKKQRFFPVLACVFAAMLMLTAFASCEGPFIDPGHGGGGGGMESFLGGLFGSLDDLDLDYDLGEASPAEEE